MKILRFDCFPYMWDLLRASFMLKVFNALHLKYCCQDPMSRGSVNKMSQTSSTERSARDLSLPIMSVGSEGFRISQGSCRLQPCYRTLECCCLILRSHFYFNVQCIWDCAVILLVRCSAFMRRRGLDLRLILSKFGHWAKWGKSNCKRRWNVS